MIRAVSSLLVGVLLVLVPAARAGKRALCIGNNAYSHATRLKNAGNDASDMAAALRKAGFDVTVRVDLNYRKLETALQDFSRSVSERDTVVFFYSGHGVQVGGVNYLVPVDTDLAGTDRRDLRYKAVSADQVLETIRRGYPGLSVMILDACRNDPFGDTRAMGSGLAPMEAALGTVIVFSTGAGRTASDNPSGRNGLFTKHLLENIDQKLPFVDLIRQVREKVYTDSGGQQRPYLQEDVIGGFVLAGDGQTAAGPQTPGAGSGQSSGQRQTSEPLVNKGMRLFQAGQFAEAAAAFESARRAEPEDSFAHNAAGVALDALGQQARAVECFNAAIRLKPAYAAAFVNRGLAYLKVPRYELAERDFSWAIEEDTDNPLVWLWRGKARLGLRRNDEAMEDLDRALDLDRGSAEGWRLRGQARYRLKQYSESLTDLNQAILITPDDPQNYTVRAATYRALGRHRDAELDERRASQLRDKGPQAFRRAASGGTIRLTPSPAPKQRAQRLKKSRSSI